VKQINKHQTLNSKQRID